MDGLLRAGVPGVQLTWMDAKVGDWVVTPRIGKPVEVQALWINALAHRRSVGRALDGGAPRHGSPSPHVSELRRGGLYDVIDADHVPGSNGCRIRPNQIFAVGGLPYPVLEGAAARAVVDLVEAQLLTPLGLRTLSPTIRPIVPRLRGGAAERDGAYHRARSGHGCWGRSSRPGCACAAITAARKAEARSAFSRRCMRTRQTAGLDACLRSRATATRRTRPAAARSRRGRSAN